jgi:hypothetical protein
VRLRPLTEAECYARCYGGRREEAVSLVWVGAPQELPRRSESPREPYDGSVGKPAAEGRDAA